MSKDRDYYWKKQRGGDQPVTSQRIKNKSIFSFLLLPALSTALFWFGFSLYLAKQKEANAAPQSLVEPVYKASLGLNKGSKILYLKADHQGHFRGELLINNIAMPFLIDTGATITVIPEKMARKANLSIGKKGVSNTAGGQVFDYRTRINILKIGDIVIKDVDAIINQHVEEVLIGMNTLKYFQMTLNKNRLTLIGNSDDLNYVNAQTDQILQPVKKKSTIKKTVTCDKNNVCRTSYTNY
jgi:aspartyl protease family protein